VGKFLYSFTNFFLSFILDYLFYDEFSLNIKEKLGLE